MGGHDPAEQVLLLLITFLVSRCYATHQHQLHKNCPCVLLIDIASQAFIPTFCIAWLIEVLAGVLVCRIPRRAFSGPHRPFRPLISICYAIARLCDILLHS